MPVLVLTKSSSASARLGMKRPPQMAAADAGTATRDRKARRGVEGVKELARRGVRRRVVRANVIFIVYYFEVKETD